MTDEGPLNEQKLLQQYEDHADELLQASMQFQFEYRMSRLNPVQFDRIGDVSFASRRLNSAIQKFIETKSSWDRFRLQQERENNKS